MHCGNVVKYADKLGLPGDQVNLKKKSAVYVSGK